MEAAGREGLPPLSRLGPLCHLITLVGTFTML